MKWSFPTKCFAHRGGGTLWPENTLSAIEFGKSLGYKAVEFDVMLSKDKIPFLMHDDVFGRTIRNPSLVGKSFADITSEELLKQDAGSWFDSSRPELATVGIPLFEDVLKYCLHNDVYMNIEIKPVPGYESITGECVARMTAQYFPADSAELSTQRNVLPLFSSFSYESLLAAQATAPHIPRGYLIDNVADEPEWLSRLRLLNAVSLHTNWKHLTPEVVRIVKEEGLSLFCYTVNSVEEARRLISMGMDAFCTDKLDLFQYELF
jgi:glycerophosphoryl diester phosphodiesterase